MEKEEKGVQKKKPIDKSFESLIKTCLKTCLIRKYVCYGKCEKLENIHIFRLVCIILKIGLFIRDFE